MRTNMPSLAIEMMLETLEQGKRVIMYGTGDSMSPTIENGNALTVAPPESIMVGDIVVLLIEPGYLVAHRIIDVGSRKGNTYVQTKGDNLDTPDPRRGIDLVKGKVVEIKKI